MKKRILISLGCLALVPVLAFAALTFETIADGHAGKTTGAKEKLLRFLSGA